jgi:quercetin dioxygenase-like cupin family protein
MKKYNLKDFTRGWLIGDFEPSILRTTDFEFMVRSYKVGEHEAKHVHQIADEISVVVHGTFKMNGETLTAGDVIHLSPGDPADFECIEDGATAVIKTPSVQGDKYPID